MATGYININGNNGTIEINADDLNGQGGANAPELSINVKFTSLSREADKIYLLTHADARLVTIDGIAIGENSLAFGYRINQNGPTFVNFRFPISEIIISKVERSRNQNLKLVLNCNLQLAEYDNFVVGGQQKTFITNFHTGSGQIQFEVEQSRWVTKVLPQWGFQKTIILELPAFTDVVPAEYKSSTVELQAAVRYFNNGDYDKAVGHCRSALEPFKRKMDDLKEHIKSTHEFEFVKKLNEATEAWLDTLLRSTFAFTAKPHHVPSLGHFERADAEIIIMITSGIIGFIGKTKFKAD